MDFARIGGDHCKLRNVGVRARPECLSGRRTRIAQKAGARSDIRTFMDENTATLCNCATCPKQNVRMSDLAPVFRYWAGASAMHGRDCAPARPRTTGRRIIQVHQLKDSPKMTNLPLPLAAAVVLVVLLSFILLRHFRARRDAMPRKMARRAAFSDGSAHSDAYPGGDCNDSDGVGNSYCAAGIENAATSAGDDAGAANGGDCGGGNQANAGASGEP
jgi:hypothetical protein